MDSEVPVRLTRTTDTSSEHQLRSKDTCLAMTFSLQVLVQSFGGSGGTGLEIHVEVDREVTM